LFGVARESGDPQRRAGHHSEPHALPAPSPAATEHGWAIIGASGQSARVYATGAGFRAAQSFLPSTPIA
jgi:hypothetical protein